MAVVDLRFILEMIRGKYAKDMGGIQGNKNTLLKIGYDNK